MPRKPKPAPAATTDSVALAGTGPYRMGDTVTVEWSTADPTPQGRVHVYAADGSTLQVAYAPLYGDTSNPDVVLGPTPVWMTPRPGTITVELVSWDPVAGAMSVLAIGPTYELAA